MEKIPAVVLAVLILLLLAGCGASPEAQNDTVTVVIVDTPRATVREPCRTVERGASVSFEISAAEGFSLTGTDYAGETEIVDNGSVITLTLLDVRYPARVSLSLTSENFVIRYEPNGGEGESFTEITEIKNHKRPNTANAKAPFSKENATLYSWNTRADGTGTAVGLGSRITVGSEGMTLYAQWAEWTDESFFIREERDGTAAVTGCLYTGDVLVVPGQLDGMPVTVLAESAFKGCPASVVILPPSIETAENGCFADAGITELYLFDNIEQLSDACFPEAGLGKLHINAYEAPAGYAKYKESCYADKLDLLILSQEENRLVFYGGCSMWYNLDMDKVLRTVGDRFTPVDMALNGAVTSELQLRIMLPYLHEGDWFFHTPELSSNTQMMRSTDMGSNTGCIWAGIEYNYDMLAGADLRGIDGVIDSFCSYLGQKNDETEYTGKYKDSHGRSFMGEHGEIPFQRNEPEGKNLGDTVEVWSGMITEESISRLGSWYSLLQSRGVRVFFSYACMNLDALSYDDQSLARSLNTELRTAIQRMPGVELLSDMAYFFYHNGHFFDTNYHLLSHEAKGCTNQWMKALAPYLTGPETGETTQAS